MADKVAAESEPDMTLLGKLKELGTIKIVYHRMRWGQAPEPKTAPRTKKERHSDAMIPEDVGSKPLLKEDTVAEENLKGQAISHQAR